MTSGIRGTRVLNAAFLILAVAGAQTKPPAAPPAPQQAPPTQPAPGQAPPAAPPTAAQAGPPQPATVETGGFLLQNVSLTEVIDILARRLKINYIVDPRFKGGSVTIHTYGEVKPTDLMPLLETILRVNGAALVQVGNLYRIVPLQSVGALPINPTINGKEFPDDERMVLNLVFLKYATAAEIFKLIQPFLGEGATAATYDPANLLILQDNSRSMKRTMELIALFDNDGFVRQRVRLFEVTNSRPSDLVKQLESVFRAFALSEKSGAVKFIPVDRINTIIAVAPNPGIFDEVDTWLKKLDIPVKAPVGAVDNYVYRLKYGRAETIAMALMALYSGNPMALLGLSTMSNGFGMGMGVGVGSRGGYGNTGGYGAGYGMGGGGMGYGAMGYGAGAYGAMGYGMGGGGMGYGYPGGGYPGAYGGFPGSYSYPSATATTSATGGSTTTGGSNATSTDLTGSYLGTGAYGGPSLTRIPHIIPNPFDNTLLVQGTPEEWEQISRLLAQLDVPPRQVLIDAKIYEVDLTGDFKDGVQAALVKKGTAGPGGAARVAGGFLANTLGGSLTMTGGILVGHSRELLAMLSATETATKAKVISAPSLIATDSIPATMNVGESVPTLTSEAVASGVQQSGTNLFANSVSNANSGVTLNVLARVNSSGIITMVINQEVSTPVPPAPTAAIQSPSFTTRSFQTQITVQDGDTVAIGGIIQENATDSSGGIPGLHRIPLIGAAFGSKNRHRDRTELIVFFTPHVIYDTTQIAEATDDLKGQLKHLRKAMKEQ